MTTELATLETLEGLTYEQMAALTGMDASTGYSLPALKVNYDDEDANGKELKKGTFVTEVDGEKVYAPTVTFRVYVNAYQYKRYDEKAENDDGSKGRYLNNSIIRRDFKGDFADELGTLKAGAVKAREGQVLSAEQIAINEQVSCYRLLFGTLTMKGKTADGKVVEIVERPTQMSLRGTNFIPFQDQVEKQLKKAKLNYIQVPLELTTRREKNGATVFYVIEWSFDRTKARGLKQEDLPILKEFDETINAINKAIMQKHNEAVRGQYNGDDADDEETLKSLRDELDDDLPI